MGFLTDFKSWLDTVLMNNPATKLRGDVFNAGLDTNLADKLVWLDQGQISTGNAIAFDNPIGRVYPDWTGAGLTGNITISSTNAVVGGRAYVKHSDSTAFTDPAEVINPTHIKYRESVDNYFEFVCVSTSPLRVHVRTLADPGEITRLDELQDVNATSPTIGSIIVYDGTEWDKSLKVLGIISTGQNLAFDSIAGRFYPSFADTAKTGAITLFSTGAQLGAKAFLKHNDATEPTWPTEIQNPGDIDYQTGADNYYEFLCVGQSPLQVWVTKLASPGSGSGDMLKSMYDPGGVEADVFDADNIVVDPSGSLSAVNVQAALEELQADIDGLSSAANPYHHAALANVAALQALNTSNATDYPSGGELTVLDVGEYWIKRGDVTAESLPNIVIDAAGNRWFRRTGTGIASTFSLGDITDVTLTSLTTGDVISYNGSSWVNGAPTGSVNNYIRPKVATTTALKALDTTSATDYPDGALILVEDTGVYRLDRDSTTTESLPTIADPTTGAGRWFQITGTNVVGSVFASGGSLPVLLTSQLGLRYGDWTTPLTDTVIPVSITGATDQGWAKVIHEGTDPLGPMFTLPDGGSIVKTGYGYVANQKNIIYLTFQTGGAIIASTHGAVHEIDTTAPTMTSAEVLNASPTFIDLTFTERVYGTTLANWDIIIDGAPAVNPIAITQNSTNTPRFELGAAVTSGQVITIEYTATAGNFVDGVGNALASFGPTSVTNSVTGIWDIMSLPGKLLYLDADDDAQITEAVDGSDIVVAQIVEGFNSQVITPAFAGTRPIRATLGGGTRVFRNDAGPQMSMVLAHATANEIPAGSGLTIAFKCLANTTGTARSIISKGNSQADAQLMLQQKWSGALIAETQETIGAVGNVLESTPAEFFDAAAVTAALFKVVVVTLSTAGVKKIRIDGVEVATESGLPIVANTGGWYFFTDVTGQPWSGDIEKIIVCTEELTGADLTGLETFLGV